MRKANSFVSKQSLLLIIFILSLAMAQAVASSPNAEAIMNSPGLNQALLAGNWDQVFKIFSEAKDCSLNSCAILLQAHAALAENYHNLAAAFFSLIQDSTQLETWKTWTDDFGKRSDGAAVGHYLMGDALARLCDMDGALVEFNLALKQDPDYFLARNARGVVYGILHQAAGTSKATPEQRDLLALAVQDFEDVRRMQPQFHDATINQAVAYIEGRRLVGAKEFFNRAVAADPKSALALNGRAMSNLEDGNIDAARRDLVKADSLLPSYPYIIFNAKAIVDSSDTTSAIGRIAWIKGKDVILDTTKGAFEIGVNVGGFADATTKYLSNIGLATTDYFTNPSTSFLNYAGNLVGAGVNFVNDLSHAVELGMDFGGVYLGAQVENTSCLVGTNYALAYPRPKDQ